MSTAPFAPPAASDDGNVLVQARALGKVYRIWNSPRARVRHALTEWASGLPLLPRAVATRVQAMGAHASRDFHALSDINFEIRRGEAVGIVGRNGSGKSTLLQLIAGILEPTSGAMQVSGSVAALLELGSGFSPDFTGRENVYLGCSLMGMSKARIDHEFDAIVRFADIGEFIDQPVRTYSSGMLLRLAFAVQTAVEPDLLIVDEALSVGDVFFQAKCMRRMRQLVEKGVTILIVSHSMPTVKEFCDRSLLLDHGHLILDSDPGRVAARYLSLSITSGESATIADLNNSSRSNEEEQANDVSVTSAEGPELDLSLGRDVFERTAADERLSSGMGGFLNVQLLDCAGDLRDVYEYDEPVTLRMIFRLNESIENLIVLYQIRTTTGISVVHGDTRFYVNTRRNFSAGKIYAIDWRFRVRLMHGSYYMSSSLAMEPESSGDVWKFIDLVPYAFGFTMAPRKEGAFGGFVVWDADVRVHEPERIIS